VSAVRQSESSVPHALIYEPRVEGHHQVWLRFITEDLLGAGWKLTLALDPSAESQERIQKRLDSLAGRVNRIPAFNEADKHPRADAGSVAACLAQSGADLVFMNCFDEIASSVLRRAAVNTMPPPALRGRLGGIYLRPRFLDRREFSPNSWIKSLGFARLMRGGWFTHLLFLEQQLKETCERKFPNTPAFVIPAPFPDNFATDAAEARRHFEVPEGRRVFLFYGGAYRRKGFHLAVEAMLALPKTSPAFLLCAGESSDAAVEQGLQTLSAQGRAKVIRRYIFEAEEKQLFAASDAVLLPYLKHFGASAVLSRSVGAAKMVIASDEQFVGRTVRENNLGLLFPSGDAAELRESIRQSVAASPEQWARWREAAENFSPRWSRAAFRSVLIESFRAAAIGLRQRKQLVEGFS